MPLPLLLGHVERELAVTVRRRGLLAHSVRRKLEDRRALSGVPTTQKDTQSTDSSSDTLPRSVVGGVALTRVAETSRTYASARPAHPVELAASDWPEEPAAEKRDRS